MLTRSSLLLLIGACGANPLPETAPPALASTEEAAPALTEQSRARIEPAPGEIEQAEIASPSVRPLSQATIVGPMPRLEIARPRDGQLIRRGDLMIDLRTTNWPLSEESGNHVHVVVDGREEIAVHAAGVFSLNERYQRRFGEELPEGTHTIRAFLSRRNHEGVKVHSAFKMLVVHYHTRSEVPQVNPRAPMLTYSRPQGCASDTSRLLDFHITNLNDLAPYAYRVRYEIDGIHRGELTEWTPYRIDDLSDADHTVRLTLIGPNGEPVPGPYNDVTRTISSGAGCPSLGLVPDDDADEDDEAL